MRKIVLVITLLFSLGMADSVLLIKKGWQLVGSSIDLESMSKFTSDNVEQIWHFDATQQKWLGYSPESSIQSKMDAQNIDRLKKLKSWHGFWIKSKKDWYLSFKDKKLESEPSISESSDTIELKKGWNLISLPVDMVISADIFKGMTVWKYNSKKEWEFFDNVDSTESFPPLAHIKNSDGLWVKADKNRYISVVKEVSKLHNFNTQKEMESYIKEMATIYQRPYYGIEPILFETNDAVIFETTALPSNSDEASTTTTTRNASDTNLQESSVDEADIMKHNREYIFYVGRKDGRKEHINVTSFNALANGKKPEFKSITFTDKRNIDAFYLVDNKLIVLSRSYSDYEIEEPIKVKKSLVDIFDISDISNIKKIANYQLDGHLKNSRVVNGRLYLISSFTPQYTITYPKIYITPSESCKKFINGDVELNDKSDFSQYAECYNINQESGKYFRYNYDRPDVNITDLLPEIEGTDLTLQSLIVPKRLYASSKKNQIATMTTISSFSLDNAKYLKSTSFIGDSSVEYASSKSLYLLSSAYPFYYDFNNYKERSTIYKFNFDENLSYRAIGLVYGTALNQFSLSEYNNILRLATTEGFSWSSEGTKNRLYTLKENQSILDIEGILTGLGEEGERVKSVRFMGNRAYLVTFKTTDPLYTIDLSDPKAPMKMGELKVDGYSAYLHPIDEDKLLGIGQNSDREGNRLGLKVELFDISDLNYPLSLDTIFLPNHTYSELEHNHKALAFRESDNLFSFPYTQYIRTTIGSSLQHNLGIYQVTNNSLKSYQPINSNSKNWNEHRGLIFDHNNKTYISLFSDDTVITKILKEK